MTHNKETIRELIKEFTNDSKIFTRYDIVSYLIGYFNVFTKEMWEIVNQMYYSGEIKCIYE